MTTSLWRNHLTPVLYYRTWNIQPDGLCFCVDRKRFQDGDQEESDRRRAHRGKRKAETDVGRDRFDRSGRGFHVGLRRVRAGRHGGQIAGRSRGRLVVRVGRHRYFVVGCVLDSKRAEECIGFATTGVRFVFLSSVCERLFNAGNPAPIEKRRVTSSIYVAYRI